MKPWYKSKTLWFNILTLVVAVAGLFGFANFQPDAKWMEVIAVLVSAINLVLRLVTKEPVSL